MHTMRHLLGQTGADLVEIIQAQEPCFTVQRLLTDYVLMDDLDASYIESRVHSARVFTPADGSITSVADAPRTDSEQSDLRPSEVATSINDLLFGERIVVNGVMAASFSSVVHDDPLLKLDTVAATEVGIRAAGLYELGHFVGKQVFGKLMRAFHTIHIPVPSSRNEWSGFMGMLVDEFTQRGQDLQFDDSDFSEQAKNIYGRDIRPERFASRFGIYTLGLVSPSLNAESLFAAYRRRVFDDNLGSVVSGIQQGHHADALDITDYAKLLPLTESERRIQCSWISDPSSFNDVIPIS